MTENLLQSYPYRFSSGTTLLTPLFGGWRFRFDIPMETPWNSYKKNIFSCNKTGMSCIYVSGLGFSTRFKGVTGHQSGPP